MLLPPPFGFISSAALQVLDIGFRQNSRERNERKRRIEQIQANLNMERTTGLGQVIPDCFGECVVPGALVFKDSQNDLNRGRVTVQANQLGVMDDLGDLGDGDTQTGTATARAGAGDEALHFVMEQFAIAHGEIHALRNVLINGEPLVNRATGRPNTEATFYGSAVAEFNQPGQASELATDFVKMDFTPPGAPASKRFNVTGRVQSKDRSAERSAASTGNNEAKVTIILNLLHDGASTQLSRAPGYQFVLSGKPIPLIQANGTLGTPVYQDANGVRVGTNLAAQIVWFLMNRVGITADEIDLAECKTRGQDRCAPVVLGTRVTANDLATVTTPNLRASNTNSTYQQDLVAMNYGTTAADLTNDDNTDYTSQDIRHSGHMPLLEPHTRKTWLERMMMNAPGTVLGRTSAGGLYVDMPDSTRTAADQSAAAAVTDANLVAGTYITVDHPGERTLATRVRATFRSLNKNGEHEAAQYPDTGSADETAINAAVGRVREKEYHIPGIVTKAHAHSWCRTMLAMSFERRFQWMMPRAEATYGNGDVVLINSQKQGINFYARIMERESRGNLAVSYTAIQFSPSDYEFVPDSKDSALPDSVRVALAMPEAPTVVWDSATHSLHVTFAPIPGFQRIELQRAIIGVDGGRYTAVGTFEGDMLEHRFFDIPDLSQTWRLRIRGIRIPSGARTAPGPHAEVDITAAIVSAGGLPPPTLATVPNSGDDPRVVFTDPSITTNIRGYQVDLQEGSGVGGVDWFVFSSREYDGLTGNMGRGRTFPEVPPGTYRFRARSLSDGGNIDSPHSYTNVFTVMDTGDAIPGAPPAPTVEYLPDERVISVMYQDPAEPGDGALVAFAFELYKDGTLNGNRIAVGRKGVRQGRSFDFMEVTEAGTYYVTVAALNGNNNGTDSATTTDINRSPFSAGVMVGDARPRIENKLRVLSVGEMYQFRESDFGA